MSVRLSVCVSLQKSAVTFDSLDGPARNFQGPLNSSQEIFWAGDSDPRALGVRPGPQKRGFLPNLSPPGVLGQGGRVAPFRNRDNEANKMLGAEF